MWAHAHASHSCRGGTLSCLRSPQPPVPPGKPLRTPSPAPNPQPPPGSSRAPATDRQRPRGGSLGRAGTVAPVPGAAAGAGRGDSGLSVRAQHPDRDEHLPRPLRARRFTARINAGIELDDVKQVGTIGLIKAIDRFDPDREVDSSTRALPYITGEIKRYFRDTTWAVHVPRRLQELRVELAKSQEALTEVLGRAPSVKEIAEHLELSEEDVIEGLVAADGYSSASIDSATGATERAAESREGRPLSDTVGDVDPAMALFEDFHTLAPLLRDLDGRDRKILRMRFAQEMTQSEIDAELGISQMQVSRLLTRILTHLRTGMLTAWTGRAPQTPSGVYETDPDRRRTGLEPPQVPPGTCINDSAT